MKIEKDSKLFIVEFGRPDTGSFFSFGNNQVPLYVIAKSYDEAAQKALEFATEAQEERDAKTIITSDGSLNVPNEAPLQIRGVRLACEAFIY